jgi:hypothetical protein
VAICGIIIGAATVSEGTDQILHRYSIEGTVFGATVVTAVLTIEDLFLTVRPIRLGVPEIGIGNVIGSLIFSVTGHRGPRRGQRRDRLERPALAPPGALRPDRRRRGLHVDREPQTLARLRAACALHPSPTGSSVLSSTAALPSTTDNRARSVFAQGRNVIWMSVVVELTSVTRADPRAPS